VIEEIGWVLRNIALGFVNLVKIIVTGQIWPRPGDMAWTSKLIYYGASSELFFIVLDIFLVLLAIGLWRRPFLWSFVRGSEFVNNSIGRLAAWTILIMVLQQTMVVALQRVFRASEITLSPFGYGFTKDVSWFSEELKLYNAIIVTLCAAYTFIQGGHVRVDLIYSAVGFRARKIIDMFGSLFFAVPFLLFVWVYGWFFMWRHLVRPPIASNYDLDRITRTSSVLKWDVETIGFSPNGFDAYFLFKVLLIAFAGLMLLQAVTFFYRSLLEFLEGPESENRYLDSDLDREADAIAESPGHGA
jgi:TRAP-type mannitol/chloroaromatic compound transport system permease small subunit